MLFLMMAEQSHIIMLQKDSQNTEICDILLVTLMVIHTIFLKGNF